LADGEFEIIHDEGLPSVRCERREWQAAGKQSG
jgi:hypothetical protein